MDLDATLAGPSTHAEAHGPGPGSSPNPSGDSLEPGICVGRHVLLNPLGAGGMGVVWAAYDPELDRRVAIKLLLPQRRGGDAARERLLREAQALAKLNHPNVVSIYDVGLWSGQVWLAMEYVEGGTLGSWVAAQPRDWRETLRQLRGAGAGLVCAHASGLIHRDFKPDNVMVGADGRARVMDFGLARGDGEEDAALDAEAYSELSSNSVQTRRLLQSKLTVVGSLMGTPAYMAAELYLGGEADQRSDQFAFCVTAWELLYGERPFAGSSLAELSYAVCEGRLRPPPRDTRVPKWVRAVLERGLELQPKRRWPSMEQLLEALANDPSIRRRRLLVGALVVAAGAAALAWVQLDRARTRASCELRGQALAQMWSATTQQTEAALLATGRDYASDTWTRTRTQLDNYASAWSEAQTRVCMAEVEGSLDTASAEVASGCLSQSESAFRALVERLAEGGDDNLRRALESAIELPPLAQCEDASWLRRQPPPPDSATAEAAAQLRDRLRERAVLESLAHHDEALAVARALVPEAEALAWAPLEAEAHYHLGSSLGQVGEYELAIDTLTRAFSIAARVGHDEFAASAALALGNLLSQRLGRNDEAMRWATLAEIFVVRSDNVGGLLDARSQDLRAFVHSERGEFEAALAANDAALATTRDLLGEAHPSLGRTLNTRGNVYNARDMREQAVASYEQSLAVLEHVYGAGHPSLAAPLNNLGGLQLARGEYELAASAFTRALDIRSDAYGPEHPRTLFCLNNLGSVQMRQGQLELAIETLERVAQLRRSALGPTHPHLATTLHNLGYAYLDLEQYARAHELFEEAMDIRAQAYSPTHVKVGSSHHALGNSLQEIGEPKRALASLRTALELFIAQYGESSTSVANVRVSLANAHLALGSLDDATRELDAAFAAFATSEASPRELAGANFARARTSFARGDIPASEAALADARRGYREAGPGAAPKLTRLERWAAEHPAPALE